MIILAVAGISLYLAISYLHISLWWILLAGIVTGLIFGKVFCRWVCPMGLIMELLMGMSPEGKIKQMYMYHKVGCPIAWISEVFHRVYFPAWRLLDINKQLRINERIRVREVRLIDEEGHQAGVVQTRDALQRAKDNGLDLIEVAPTANPPVCRIMDYGKFKYEQAKREKEAHKKSKQAELALIRVRPNIDEHDFNVKLKNARKFLEDGDKVRIFVVFKSREFTHPEFGRGLLNKFYEGLSELANVEKSIGMEGRQMTMVLSPKPKVPAKPLKPAGPPQQAQAQAASE